MLARARHGPLTRPDACRALHGLLTRPDTRTPPACTAGASASRVAGVLLTHAPAPRWAHAASCSWISVPTPPCFGGPLTSHFARMLATSRAARCFIYHPFVHAHRARWTKLAGARGPCASALHSLLCPLLSSSVLWSDALNLGCLPSAGSLVHADRRSTPSSLAVNTHACYLSALQCAGRRSFAARRSVSASSGRQPARLSADVEAVGLWGWKCGGWWSA